MLFVLYRSLLLFFSAALVLQITKAQPNSCAVESRVVWDEIRTALVATPTLIPGFIRAGFHDCITSTSDKTDSGCNGSLRLAQELDDPNNARIAPVIDFLDSLLDGSCVSYADAIQMGVEGAMNIAGGNGFQRGFLRRGRVDVDDADTVDLPSFNFNFAESREFFSRKGFNVQEMIVSLVGGHAFGRFVPPGTGGFDFTTTPTGFNIDYAVNLVQRIDTGENLPGFNTIPSDEALITDPEGALWLKFYAGRVNQNFNNFVPQLGAARLRRDFKRYLIKQSKL